MNHASKPHDLTTFSSARVSLPWRTIFLGQTSGLVTKIQGLLREQIQLLETTTVLSGAALETYETRSEQIHELIRLHTAD
jgi:hypothetical protein